MTTHSSILAWRTPWTEEPGGLYSPWGHKESDTTWWLNHNKRHQSAFSPACEDTARWRPGSRPSPRTGSAGSLLLDFPDSESVRRKCQLSVPPHLWYSWKQRKLTEMQPLMDNCSPPCIHVRPTAFMGSSTSPLPFSKLRNSEHYGGLPRSRLTSRSCSWAFSRGLWKKS